MAIIKNMDMVLVIFMVIARYMVMVMVIVMVMAIYNVITLAVDRISRLILVGSNIEQSTYLFVVKFSLLQSNLL